MMKKYEEPKMDVVFFKTIDVITASNDGEGSGKDVEGPWQKGGKL